MVTRVSTNLGDRVVGEYYTSNEIKDAIGKAFEYYTLKLIRSGEGHFKTTANLDLTADTETISLALLSPAFLKGSILWRKVTNGYIPLEKREGRYDPNITVGVGSGDVYLPKYKYRGTNIVLDPPPKTSEIAGLKLEYIYLPTFPTRSSADNFTFDSGFPTIYETNVELRATIRLLMGKEAAGAVVDYGTFKDDLRDLDNLFETERDEQPDTVEYSGVDYRNL